MPGRKYPPNCGPVRTPGESLDSDGGGGADVGSKYFTIYEHANPPSHAAHGIQTFQQTSGHT